MENENMEQEESILTLTDENGQDMDFEYLDCLTYEGKEYLVLMPADEPSTEIVILEVEPVDEEIDFYVLRKPHLNIKMEMEKKLELLWRPELVHIQQQTQMPAYKERSKAFVREKIIEKVPAPVLQQLISQELFERDYTTILEEINAFRAANHQKPRRSTRKRRKKLRPSE